MDTKGLYRFWQILTLFTGMVHNVLSAELFVNVSTCQCMIVAGGGNQTCSVIEISDPHKEFESDPRYPQPPSSISARVTAESKDEQEFISMEFSWPAPAGSSLEATKGFLLDLLDWSGDPQRLHIPVTGTLPSRQSDEVKWVLTCRGREDLKATRIWADLKVLPTPSTGSLRGPQIEFSVKALKNQNDAYSWTPFISLRKTKDEGLDRYHIIISFAVPKGLEELDKFEISIPEESFKTRIYKKDNKVEEEINIMGKCRMECCTLEIEKMCVNDCGGNFLCKDRANACGRVDVIRQNFSFAENRESDPCYTSTTEEPFSTIAPGTRGPPSQNSYVSTDGATTENTYNTEVILYIVTTTMILIIIILTATFFLMKRRTSREKLLACRPWNVCLRSRHRDEPSPPKRKVPEADLSQMEINHRPRVFLFYSDDHKYHIKAMHSFATFLQSQCGCDVIFDECFMNDIKLDFKAWYINEIDKAEKIIFVHSEGSYRKYNAHIRKEKINDTQPSPKGDVFSNILLPVLLNHCFSGRPAHERYLMVRFSYTPEKYMISQVINGDRYNIPDHLEEFMFHLHNCSKYEFGKISHFPGINCDEYHNEPEGKELKSAIESAARYAENHPNWFDERYKDAKSYEEFLLAKQNRDDAASDTSSITDHNPLNLVAPTDLNSHENLPHLGQQGHDNDFRGCYDDDPINFVAPSGHNSQENIPDFINEHAHVNGLTDFTADRFNDEENREPHGLQFIGNEPQENIFYDSGISSLNFPRFPPGNEDTSSLSIGHGSEPDLYAPESMSSLASSTELSTYFSDFTEPENFKFIAEREQHHGDTDFGRSSV